MIQKIFICFIVTFISLTVNVNSQSCSNAAAYSACSSNSECGCLPYSFASSMGVCVYINNSCSQFIRCQPPNDACPQPGYVCVRHTRCDSTPICYPLSMADDRTCPPRIVSNFTSALDITDPSGSFPALSSSGHYYEAFEIVVGRTGTYEIVSTTTTSLDTHGYLYDEPFSSLSSSTNLISQDDDGNGNLQFKLRVTLEAGHRYVLVIAGHSQYTTGSYTVTATGPGNINFIRIDPMYLTTTTTTTTLPPIIVTNYNGELTTVSPIYSRSKTDGTSYYYQAIQIRISTSGIYTFKSSGIIADTVGYLYQDSFDPNNPATNLIVQDDDNGSYGQFLITANLQSDTVYVLVFTTFNPLVTGTFFITASGPDYVIFNQLAK